MGKFARSWALTKESWSVLRAEKSLLIFPILSSAALLLVLASFAVPGILFFTSVSQSQPALTGPDGEVQLTAAQHAILWVMAFAFYFCTFTVMNFFNVALIGAAMERFAGRETGLRTGLSIAIARIPQILAWSAVAATVGVILKAVEERLGFIGQIVIRLIGMAWAIATFFVVPVLAAEGAGPVDAIKRSVGVLRKTWGEAALTRIGVGLVFGLLILAVALIGTVLGILAAVSLQSFALGAAIAVIMVCAVIVLSLISTTLQSILQAALYRYAVDGAIPSGFSQATLAGVFQPKKKK